MHMSTTIPVALFLLAAGLASQEPSAPGWSSPENFAAPAGSQEATDAARAAEAWGRFRTRASYRARTDPKFAAQAEEDGSAIAVLMRRGRFAALPYPAGSADGGALRVPAVPAADLQEPGSSAGALSAWLPIAFRDGIDAPYAAARAALGDRAFARPDGTPRPEGLSRALEEAGSSAGAWLSSPEAAGDRFARAVRAWARFRAEGRGAPFLPTVAQAELSAALEWGSRRSAGRPPSRDALATLAVAWMARKRPEALRSAYTLEVVSIRRAGSIYASVSTAAGPGGMASLMTASRAAGFEEGGTEHRAAAMALLDESPTGAWGVPTEVRRALRKAAGESRAYPLVTPAQAMDALDGISGLAEARGSDGRREDEEAVAAAFREPPTPALAWSVVDEWQRKADAAKADLEQSEKGLRAAKRINRTMGDALGAYDAWVKEGAGPRKTDLDAAGREAVARLRTCLDEDGALLPPALVAKGRDVVALAEAKFGK